MEVERTDVHASGEERYPAKLAGCCARLIDSLLSPVKLAG